MTQTSTPVTPRILAVVACRILALYILFLVLQGLPYLTAAVLGSTNFASMASDAWLPLLHTTYLVMLCVLLWFGADWVAHKMVPVGENKPAAPEQAALDLEHLSAVLVSIVGLVFLTNALLQLVGVLFVFSNQEPSVNLAHLISRQPQIVEVPMQ